MASYDSHLLGVTQYIGPDGACVEVIHLPPFSRNSCREDGKCVLQFGIDCCDSTECVRTSARVVAYLLRWIAMNGITDILVGPDMQQLERASMSLLRLVKLSPDICPPVRDPYIVKWARSPGLDEYGLL